MNLNTVESCICVDSVGIPIQLQDVAIYRPGRHQSRVASPSPFCIIFVDHLCLPVYCCESGGLSETDSSLNDGSLCACAV